MGEKKGSDVTEHSGEGTGSIIMMITMILIKKE